MNCAYVFIVKPSFLSTCSALAASVEKRREHRYSFVVTVVLYISHGSDFRVGQICGNRYVIHLGRWSSVWKRYQGGWGGGLHLHLPCPMPPSAVAAGPV